MKVLFCTNLPSPYRVEFFNELGKYCDLTVCYERKTSAVRDAKWKGNEAATYKEVYLDLKPLGEDKSIGTALIQYIKSARYDHIILTNHASPAVMGAILYCRIKHIPYILEHDGGFNKTDSMPKRLIKKLLLCGAKAHLTTCGQHIDYLCSLGIKREDIYKYPFSSIHEADIMCTQFDKANAKKVIGIKERQMVLAVGQFIPRKGFDVLISAMKHISSDVAVCIVGGVPTEQYVSMRDSLRLDNLYFEGFKTKQELAQYYQAADVLVLPTREDIWGLVVNEAMAYGVPVVTTDRCIAGSELIKDGVNGKIVSCDDPNLLADAICDTIDNRDYYSGRSIEKIHEYTIETMAQRHMEILGSL